jgi:dipeptidyl aminopeptidase/acylaminoacyl peptidase
MTGTPRVERELPVILADLAGGPYPDYIDDVLAVTAQRRQRRAWTFPERWLPVDLATERVALPRLPWRMLGVLALLVLLLIVAVALGVGTQPRLPAPFGPAANGIVAYADAGDIYTADPLTGRARAITTGPETDLRPRFSRDGTHVVFERVAQGEHSLYVAGSDGRDAVRVTPEAISLATNSGGSPYQFSPDGRSIAIAAIRAGGPGILLAAADGSGARWLDLAPLSDRVSTAYEPTFRPPDGKEILFAGTDSVATNGRPGLYAIDPVSGSIRTIVSVAGNADLDSGSWSPDGERLSYVT